MNWNQWIDSTPAQEVADWWNLVTGPKPLPVKLRIAGNAVDGYSSGDAVVLNLIETQVPCSFVWDGCGCTEFFIIEDVTPSIMPEGVHP